VGNHLLVIFAVLGVSCAVNSCINYSFFTFISYNGKTVPRWRTAAILKIDISSYLSEQEALLSQRGRAMLPVCH